MNFKRWLISLFSIFLIVIGGIFVRCASLYLNFFQIAILFSCNGYSIFEEYRIESHGWFEQWHVSEYGRKIVDTILPLVKMTRVRPWRPENTEKGMIITALYLLLIEIVQSTLNSKKFINTCLSSLDPYWGLRYTIGYKWSTSLICISLKINPFSNC